MGFQPRFTSIGKDEDMKEVTLPPTSRHHMLVNTWHVGVAQAVLYMFLVLALVPSAKAAALIPAQPCFTCMHRTTAWCNATPGLWQPSAADYRMGHHRTVTEDDRAHTHIAMALNVSHPALADSSLSPAAALAVWMYDTIGPDIVRWKLEVLSEIGALVDDLVPDWADTLPSHVTDAYSGKGSRLLAAPVIRVLLDAIGYPGASVLEHELTYGFPAIGQMPLGTGWPLRECPKPLVPLGRSDFLTENIAYVRETANSRKPDKHADRLLAEVWEEGARGRVRGPFHAHPRGALTRHDLVTLRRAPALTSCLTLTETAQRPLRSASSNWTRQGTSSKCAGGKIGAVDITNGPRSFVTGPGTTRSMPSSRVPAS